jgi:hypothetical protein
MTVLRITREVATWLTVPSVYEKMVMLELWWLLTLMDLQVQKQYHSQSCQTCEPQR